MFRIKTLVSQYTRSTGLKPPINPQEFLSNINHAPSTTVSNSGLISSSTQRTISVSAEPEEPPESEQSNKPTHQNENKSKTKNKKRPQLHILFKQAVGLCENSEIETKSGIELKGEDIELRNKLWELEMELRQLKKEAEEERESEKTEKEEGLKSNKPNNGGKSEKVFLKEISQDMEVLLRRMYDLGYFQNVNFLPGNDLFDVTCFNNDYARGFLRFAVERFGKDNQEISRWLSGSDLKTMALFGCPSHRKREVFAAKNLRLFFKIPEETVCSNCSLKGSCKYVNQSVWKGDTTELRVDLLMRLLSAYSLEDIAPDLQLTSDLKDCVSRLMRDVVNLSKCSR